MATYMQFGALNSCAPINWPATHKPQQPSGTAHEGVVTMLPSHALDYAGRVRQGFASGLVALHYSNPLWPCG
ncbi:unnamed protein product [Chondrus crispus]|uniref:Uncharacterized protein n=1 Tax=Chondrus crispus TaxID=2769 RepID=R7Q1E1_CHOCR|nr:unnamed protein product [Chondrus crispus]CDF32422.1 unnamed protein product [Chondrus crispus]|eukprot:XP_005712087.1 unnamed protein product [Chondrus crispus]